MVNKKDITEALKGIGIKDTDTVIFHSSLKSFGRVDGGADAVIEGIKDALKEGTVVFPTLVNRDFANAYENWDINNSPSDAGLISETFRLKERTLRSDQATHSVAAWGKYALFITKEHGLGKGRYGVFGSTPFSHSSPWQKMYDLDGKVVMLGVTMVYNTFKHFVEYCFADDVLSRLNDKERETAKSELSSWEDMKIFAVKGDTDFPGGVWFWNNGLKEQEEMKKRGLLKETLLGNANIISFKIRDFYEFLYNEFKTNPENWLNEKAAEWIQKWYHGM